MKKAKIILLCLSLFCLSFFLNAQGDYEEEPAEESEYLDFEYSEESESEESEYEGRTPVVAIFGFNGGEDFSWVDANDATAYLRKVIIDFDLLIIPSYESMESTLNEWSLDVDDCRYMYEYAAESAKVIGADFFVMGSFDKIKKRFIVKSTVYFASSGDELFSKEMTSGKKDKLHPTLDFYASSLVEQIAAYFYLLEEEEPAAEEEPYWDIAKDVDEMDTEPPKDPNALNWDKSEWDKDFSANANESVTDTSDDSFCEAITVIMAESYNNFTNVKGAELGIEGDVIKIAKYETSLILPDTDECYIQQMMGSWSYRSILEAYTNKSDAVMACESLMNKINSCLGNSIYYTVGNDNGFISYEIGAQGEDYFSSRIIYIGIYKNDEMFSVYLSASEPDAARIFSVPYSYGSNDELFDANLKKQMDNAHNKFEDIRGQEHKEESVWNVDLYYDIEAKLPGAISSIYDKSGSFITHPCESEFYVGDSKSTAEELYDELALKIKSALGADYVYRIDEIYEKDPKGKMIFAKKSELDVKTPLVVLRARELSGRYYVVIEVLFENFTGIGV